MSNTGLLGNFRAPRDAAGGAMPFLTIDELLKAEMAEQASWDIVIPAWHPRNEGDDPPKKEDPPKKDDPKAKDDDLGEKGLKALAAEREARKAAEAEAKETKRRLDALEAEKLSDQEKLEKRAKDGDTALEQATAKLRRANLLVALAGQGLSGGKGKAAAKLLDVEFDDDDEPKNLTAAIDTAKTEYGPELFTAAKAVEPGKEKDPTRSGDPKLNQGPRDTPKDDEDDAAIIQTYVHRTWGVGEPAKESSAA
jgi:hypothetical protein